MILCDDAFLWLFLHVLCLNTCMLVVEWYSTSNSLFISPGETETCKEGLLSLLFSGSRSVGGLILLVAAGKFR